MKMGVVKKLETHGQRIIASRNLRRRIDRTTGNRYPRAGDAHFAAFRGCHRLLNAETQ